ncbi:retinol dehydrogenase 12-like [Onthophagus taurus]|uniref:retinol dehydrogenase 12-like n=1 Tax=Onthophagus taurus TaxID=166361 RepID=UPI0039BE308A
MVVCTLGTIILIFLLTLGFFKVISKLTMGWCKSNTCLVGKTVIITGGNSGIGFQTAMALAGRGAKVIIGDVVNSDDSVKQIISETNNPNVRGKHLDLASLDSVRKFCKEIYEEEDRLDILINNAGVGGAPLGHTSDGIQIHMQINYFGHFLLTHLLIGLLKRNKSRIIFVSSIAAFKHNLSLETLNNPTVFKQDLKTHFTIYGNSKLCELIASNIFAEKLKNTTITSNALYPGTVNTPIIHNTGGVDAFKYSKMFAKFCLFVGGKTPYEGAQTQINCALSRDLDGVSGKYFVDCKPFYQPRLARDKEFCKQLWDESERLVKLKPEEKIENVLRG